MRKLDVNYISQKGAYPTGCESISAVMLLNFLGINITPDEFIKDHLPKKDFHTDGGILYGPDPNKFFAGSPYDENSFGCYAPVMVNALESVFKNVNTQNIYSVVNETGTPLQSLCEKYIDRGYPVLTWTCINMREPITGPIWKLDDGSDFTWTSNEHCMLLTGYDENNYIFNDPFDGNGVVVHPKALSISRYNAQKSQAVAVIKNS